MRALVVFHGHGRHWLAPLLAPGFRHCFVALASGAHWIVVDGAAGRPDIRVVAPIGHDLALFYRAQGYRVVETEIRPAHPRQPLMIATCVGATKRIIGLGAPFVLTPKGLYRHLTRHLTRRTSPWVSSRPRPAPCRRPRPPRPRKS